MTHPRGVSSGRGPRVSRAFVAAAFLALLAAVPAFAELPGDVPDKIRIAAGGLAAETYTDAGLGSTSAGIGASVNFEDIFNLPESKDIWRVELNWHINKRQFLDFGYFESNFPYVAWRYSFLDLPQVRISGSAGFDYLSLETSLKANGNVTDQNGTPEAGAVEEKVSVSAPVPQLGLQIDWALTRRLAVLLYSRQIYVNMAGIDGGIGENAMRLSWWYSKHAGITGGLDKESIDLKSYESGDTRARFRYEVRGFSFYLNLAF